MSQQLVHEEPRTLVGVSLVSDGLQKSAASSLQNDFIKASVAGTSAALPQQQQPGPRMIGIKHHPNRDKGGELPPGRHGLPGLQGLPGQHDG